MESVEAAAAVRASRVLGAELVECAAALARGRARKGNRRALLPRGLRIPLQRAEARARRVPAGLEQVAALDFLGDAVAAIAVDHRFDSGEARAAVIASAEVLGIPADAAAFLVFRRALASKECIELPGTVAAELVASLLVELAPAAAASLWVVDSGGLTTFLVGQGKAPRSRGLHEVARASLDGVVLGTGQIRVHVVERWDRPYAALVARGRGGGGGPAYLDDYLAEAARALAPMLERAVTIDRELENERQTVAASERRLVRLGFDLHDGPLQEIVVLAEELRLASEQIGTLVDDRDKSRVRGRFDDLHARLDSLNEGVREIAAATRSATTKARPVEQVLASELRTLEQTTRIETELDIEGEFDELTDSQKIVLFRVAQEALSNVRKHSGATRVSVVLRSTRTFLDLTVSDDGCGFDPLRVPGDRLGLAGIAERVRLLGGVVEIESGEGRGARIRAVLPQWRPSRPGVAALSAAEAG